MTWIAPFLLLLFKLSRITKRARFLSFRRRRNDKKAINFRIKKKV